MSVANVAIQLTLADLASRGLMSFKSRLHGLSQAGEETRRSFDRMVTAGKWAAMAGIGTRALARGLMPGVDSAARLQAATLRVKGNLAGSAKDARELNDWLRQVAGSAGRLSANAPLSATDVINIENSLLKAGLALSDVTGKAGAAFAAVVLSSLSGEDPGAIGDSLANIGSMFDLKGGQYGELADWLVRVDDAGATTIPELVQGLRMAGSTAKLLGISAKDSITTLGALAPLGDRAGSSFNNLLIGMTKSRAFFKDGKFIGLPAATALLKKTFGGIADEQVRMRKMNRLFGEEGARAAGVLLEASKGFAEIERAAEGALSAARKMDIWAQGFSASMAKLRGTADTALGTLFQPMLKPLTEIANKTNQWLSSLNQVADKHEAIGKTVSYGALAAVGTGGLAAAGLIGASLLYGSKVLKGVGGIRKLFSGAGSTAAGIAKGKAIEAATGVVPVFVTNWPAGGLLGDAGAGGLAAAGGGGLLATAGKWAGGIALAAAVGGIVGTIGDMWMSAVIKWWSDGKSENLGEWMYNGLHKNAAINQDDAEWTRDAGYARAKAIFAASQASGFGQAAQKNEIHLSVNIDPDGRVYTETGDMATVANVDVRKGKF